MSSIHRQTRILALDPGIREMGFALLNGDTLIRYGVRNSKKRCDKTRNNGRVAGIDLIDILKPDVLILGKPTHPERKMNPMLKNLTNQIKRFALKKETSVQEIELGSARKFLIMDRRPTKMNAAELIAAAYPELSAYLPKTGRILWSHKDIYWMNMFDALTLGLFYLRKRKKRKDTSTYLNSKREALYEVS